MLLDRLRRTPVRSLLLAAALLEIGGVVYLDVYARLSPTVSVSRGEQLVWLAIDLLLIRGIWRRSAVARYVLVGLAAVPMVLLLLTAIELDGLAAGELFFAAAELVLLFTPQVRSHVRAGRARRAPRATRP